MTARKTYKVPAIFYLDHYGRGCGETDVIVKQDRYVVTVEMDYTGYQDLLSDADYYWDCREMMDMCNPKIIRSAKRTLAALAKQPAPEKVGA